MQPHYSQSSRENATPSSGTSLLVYILGSTPPGNTHKWLYCTYVCGIWHSTVLNFFNSDVQMPDVRKGQIEFQVLTAIRKFLKIASTSLAYFTVRDRSLPLVPPPVWYRFNRSSGRTHFIWYWLPAMKKASTVTINAVFLLYFDIQIQGNSPGKRNILTTVSFEHVFPLFLEFVIHILQNIIY